MAKAKMTTPFPFPNGDFAEMMDFGKFAGQFKLPNVDTQVFIEGYKRNLEAMTEANRVAIEGAQALAQRQVEIMRQSVDEATKAINELAKPGKPEDKLATQAAMVKEAYELALANARELGEISTKSNTEAADVITHRIADGLDEIKGVFTQAAK
jgi:phasin family protein